MSSDPALPPSRPATGPAGRTRPAAGSWRRAPLAFLVTLWAALSLAWALSGERFLDWAFTMPDLGPAGDGLLALLVRAEEAKAAAGLPDLFGALRAALHHWTGLG
ncbi:MAG: hypothetical protein IT545_01100 [Rhodobacteraceae bacterium]|nr:hypothetical protein [Paracoccaceae bacterium]